MHSQVRFSILPILPDMNEIMRQNIDYGIKRVNTKTNNMTGHLRRFADCKNKVQAKRNMQEAPAAAAAMAGRQKAAQVPVATLPTRAAAATRTEAAEQRQGGQVQEKMQNDSSKGPEGCGHGEGGIRF